MADKIFNGKVKKIIPTDGDFPTNFLRINRRSSVKRRLRLTKYKSDNDGTLSSIRSISCIERSAIFISDSDNFNSFVFRRIPNAKSFDAWCIFNVERTRWLTFSGRGDGRGRKEGKNDGLESPRGHRSRQSARKLHIDRRCRARKRPLKLWQDSPLGVSPRSEVSDGRRAQQ